MRDATQLQERWSAASSALKDVGDPRPITHHAEIAADRGLRHCQRQPKTARRHIDAFENLRSPLRPLWAAPISPASFIPEGEPFTAQTRAISRILKADGTK